MRTCMTLFLLLSLGAGAASAGGAVQKGMGSVTFVDGAETQCEILFEHPNCRQLVVRSPRNQTVQSFPLSQIQKVTVGGRSTPYSAPRALTDAEKKEREVNRLWGDEVSPKQIGKYGSEKWDRKPLMVWAHPGESADAMKTECWLDENGKPFSSGPWKNDPPKSKGGGGGEFDGDVLLPAAEQPYDAIQPGNRDYLSPYRVRHLTVERNASYRIRYTILGNLWIKDGAEIGPGTQTGGLGSREASKHTFMRLSGSRRVGRKGPVDPEWSGMSHWLSIETGDRGSLEVIGASGGAGDRTTLQKGTLIISEDSYLGNGSRASFYGMPGTTTIMLDGSRLGCLNPAVAERGTYGIAGTLMFGTPEHPLTRDLAFGATPYPLDKLSATAAPGQRTGGASMVLGPTGRMIVHSKDPTKARVVFAMRPEEGVPESKRRDGSMAPALTGITAVFAGQTDFNGVVFDGFYKGGIVVSSQARQRWKNVFFGSRNQGKPDELFRNP